MKPTIGIIGGCGPLATVDIEYKILKAINRLISPMLDQDYFNMLVFNYTQFADRNDAIAINNQTLFEQFLRCAFALESVGIDLLLVACQTAHVYISDLKSAVNLPIVDIIEETVRHVVQFSPSISKVGLLSTEATQKKGLYQRAFAFHNIEVVTIEEKIQNKVMEAIYILKTGIDFINARDPVGLINNNKFCIDNPTKYPEIKAHPYRRVLLEKFFPNPLVTIQEAIEYLVTKDCEHIILGCTELPLILPHMDFENRTVNLIDPNSIVAEAVVHLASKLEKNRLNNEKTSANLIPESNNDEVFKVCVE
jgi:aspartate racemase